MIALVGHSVIDRVKFPGRPWIDRLGGAPIFAGQALAAAGREGVILTRGATPELCRPLHELGLRVIEGPSTQSCISEMEFHPDGTLSEGFGGFGDPFTPADVAGWMAPGLAGAQAVVCGSQWRDDFLPEALAALAAGGRPVYLDGQGPLRMRQVGPLRLEGALPAEWMRHVMVLKLAEEEADVAIGGINLEAAHALGVPVVVVTLAHRGAVILGEERLIEVGVTPVFGLSDTVGAGDAFLALMAAAAVDGAAPVQAVEFACAGAAAMLRSRLGNCSDVHPAPAT